MKQVSLRLRDGKVEVLDVPLPTGTPECVLVDVRASVLSVGTERSKIEAGRDGLIGKARARPDQARQVLEKARRDGWRDTVQAVRTRLNQPTALGYSAAGVVLAVGARVRGIAPGDRVACGGGDHAVHADIVQVPGNLCVPLPDNVGFEAGAFATIASVAMHGVRQADARIGERVVVLGLGLVGQLTAQILRAAGCVVIGIDLSPSLVEKAVSLGSIDAGYERAALDNSDTLVGADAVIVTASTSSSDPIELAVRLLRDRGRVVVVGDVHVDVPRGPSYDRELDIRFSRSYGPGRYDREYEERGLDYPIGYVRWTEQRNMAAFLDLVGSRRVDVDGLIGERVPVERAAEAYERHVLAKSSPLGVVLQYGATQLESGSSHGDSRDNGNGRRGPADSPRTACTVNVIGAGSFARRVLIPGLAKAGFTLGAVASAKGLSAKAAADEFGFARMVTPEEAIADPDAGVLAIATRHAAHAALAEAALLGGKAVFVEKPPCLTVTELDALRLAVAESGQPLFVGFNRRHAHLARVLREHVRAVGGPIDLMYRVNAGPLPAHHWLADPEDGGGRLLGEGCHFVDFACWVVGSAPQVVKCTVYSDSGRALGVADGFTVLLEFADGSTATVLYSARGATGLGKEYVEAHAGGRSAILDDFAKLTLVGGRRPTHVGRRRDKGHLSQFAQLRRVLTGGDGDGAFSDPDPLGSMEATLSALRDAHRLPDNRMATCAGSADT
ncbi:MAG: Gfo/Idh/MocA family oxidoreductase [Solirubrobacteraceae bacterium]